MDVHVKADLAPDAVRIPRRHGSAACPGLHEAVMVPVVADAFTPAIARDVLQHFRMAGGKLVRLADNGHRAGRGEGDSGKGWQRPTMCREWGRPPRGGLGGLVHMLLGFDRDRASQERPQQETSCCQKFTLRHRGMVADLVPDLMNAAGADSRR